MAPAEWLAQLAAALDEDVPTPEEVEDLLSLAGTAAHSAERWVAPLTTWLTARAGLAPDVARRLVEQLAAQDADGADAPTDGD